MRFHPDLVAKVPAFSCDVGLFLGLFLGQLALICKASPALSANKTMKLLTLVAALSKRLCQARHDGVSLGPIQLPQRILRQNLFWRR